MAASRLNLLVLPWCWPHTLDPFKDLPIGLDNTPEILAETILVEDAILPIGLR